MQWESCLPCSSFAFWVFSTQILEAVIFAQFGLACRPLGYLDVLFYIDRMHHVHACVKNARCAITRFAYNASHIIMTSAVFAFYLCHIGMKWHDMIGACIA